MSDSTKRCKFSETLWEDYVEENPKEFLNEELIKNTRQKVIPAGKSDLTFRDKSNRLVLVELQLDALDRKHMSQTLEYRMDYIDLGEKNIRTILLCNEIKEKRKTYIDKWNKTVPNLNLETIVISQDKCREIIQKIDPAVEWIDIKKPSNEKRSTQKQKFKTKIKEKIDRLTKGPELWEAMKSRKSVSVIKNLLFNEKISKRKICPQEFNERISSKNIIEKRPILRSSMINLFNLYKELKEISNSLKGYDSIFTELHIVENYMSFFEDKNEYKELLYMPQILNKKKLDPENLDEGKPEIDLIIFTDTYFGRHTLKLLWQPSNWRYTASYDAKKKDEILKIYKDKKEELLRKNKNKDENKPTSWFTRSDEEIEIIREKNIALNELRKWEVSDSDFNIAPKFADSYTNYKANKDFFTILEIKQAFPLTNSRARMHNFAYNFWGRLAVCLNDIVCSVYDSLKYNFKVNLKGKIKYITEDTTDDDVMMFEANDYVERNRIPSTFPPKDRWAELGKTVVVGCEIEDANHKVGAKFKDPEELNLFTD